MPTILVLRVDDTWNHTVGRLMRQVFGTRKISHAQLATQTRS